MSDYRLPASAIEAAARALWPEHEHTREYEVWTGSVEAALRAAFDELGPDGLLEIALAAMKAEP